MHRKRWVHKRGDVDHVPSGLQPQGIYTLLGLTRLPFARSSGCSTSGSLWPSCADMRYQLARQLTAHIVKSHKVCIKTYICASPECIHNAFKEHIKKHVYTSIRTFRFWVEKMLPSNLQPHCRKRLQHYYYPRTSADHIHIHSRTIPSWCLMGTMQTTHDAMPRVGLFVCPVYCSRARYSYGVCECQRNSISHTLERIITSSTKRWFLSRRLLRWCEVTYACRMCAALFAIKFGGFVTRGNTYMLCVRGALPVRGYISACVTSLEYLLSRVNI